MNTYTKDVIRQQIELHNLELQEAEKALYAIEKLYDSNCQRVRMWRDRINDLTNSLQESDS